MFMCDIKFAMYLFRKWDLQTPPLMINTAVIINLSFHKLQGYPTDLTYPSVL